MRFLYISGIKKSSTAEEVNVWFRWRTKSGGETHWSQNLNMVWFYLICKIYNKSLKVDHSDDKNIRHLRGENHLNKAMVKVLSSEWRYCFNIKHLLLGIDSVRFRHFFATVLLGEGRRARVRSIYICAQARTRISEPMYHRQCMYLL